MQMTTTSVNANILISIHNLCMFADKLPTVEMQQNGQVSLIMKDSFLMLMDLRRDCRSGDKVNEGLIPNAIFDMVV